MFTTGQIDKTTLLANLIFLLKFFVFVNARKATRGIECHNSTHSIRIRRRGGGRDSLDNLLMSMARPEINFLILSVVS
jgi:hypothetical protein